MGRESHDPTGVHSSIALLQERFRQLQRVKEMREERELQKMHTETKQFNSHYPTTAHEPTRVFSHPELIIPSRSPPHVSLSLWPTSQEDHRRVQTPVSMNLRPTDYTHTMHLQASWTNVNDSDSGSGSGSGSDSGVDTSLHL